VTAVDGYGDAVESGASLIYAARLLRLPLLAADGAELGRVVDVVLVPPHLGKPPRVIGFVASIQRRQIFVNAARVGRVDITGVNLATGTIDLRHFRRRSGELLISALLTKRLADEVVNDVGLTSMPVEPGWEVATVSLRHTGTLRRRTRTRIVPWYTTDVLELFDAGPLGTEVAALRELHPNDLAKALRAMPLERRRYLASAMDDDRLADLLEELDEDEQLALVEGLDIERLADILEEMAPDDAADLLAEMPRAQRIQMLDAMEPDEAAPLRRLLLYGEETAGGLMNPEPLIATPGMTVAEAMARMRDADVPVALAAHIFVVEPPKATPTGRYLGAVGFQRLLREPPGTPIEQLLDEHQKPVGPEMPTEEVAARLAGYNQVALPVCDAAGRLVGAVTVDDVLDHALPEDWRDRA
jgi:CBS domain-containing protein